MKCKKGEFNRFSLRSKTKYKQIGYVSENQLFGLHKEEMFWVLTHIPSGTVIYPFFKSKKQATNTIDSIIQLPIKWELEFPFPTLQRKYEFFIKFDKILKAISVQ